METPSKGVMRVQFDLSTEQVTKTDELGNRIGIRKRNEVIRLALDLLLVLESKQNIPITIQLHGNCIVIEKVTS